MHRFYKYGGNETKNNNLKKEVNFFFLLSTIISRDMHAGSDYCTGREVTAALSLVEKFCENSVYLLSMSYPKIRMLK